jgi:D-alanyl-D-alanine carboxypeptidase
MARLSSICMQIPLFRKIAGTKVYECHAVRAIQRSVTHTSHVPPANLMAAMGCSASSSCEESSEQNSNEEKFETVFRENDQCYNWVNTNRLLGIAGFTGVKTGITEAAGACLATSFEKDGNFIIVVILQSKTMDARWEEA